MSLEEVSFTFAAIGDILTIPNTVELPEEWVLCDGTEHMSAEWPLFVSLVGITGPTFTLPLRESAEGYQAVIRLGEKAEETEPQVQTTVEIQVANLPENPLLASLMPTAPVTGPPDSSGRIPDPTELDNGDPIIIGAEDD